MAKWKTLRGRRKYGVVAGTLFAAALGVVIGLTAATVEPSECGIVPDEVTMDEVETSAEEVREYTLQLPAIAQGLAEPEEGEAPSSSDDAVGPHDMYVPNQLLLLLDGGDTVEGVEAFLAGLDVTRTKHVSVEDVEAGFVVLELADGVDIASAQAVLVEAGKDCQPNYVYHLMDELGDGEAAGSVEFADGEADGMAAAQDDAAPEGVVPLTASSPLVEAYVINDNYYAKTKLISKGYLWGIDSVNVREAWSVVRCLDTGATPDANTITIVTMDTGCNTDHEDLKDRVVHEYDAVRQTDVNVSAVSGHGTHVAGVAAATVNNAKGVAGYSYNANLLPITVFKNVSGSATAYSTDIARAYKYVLDNRNTYGSVRVINLSVGMTYSQEQIDRLNSGASNSDRVMVNRIEEARNAGILTVCAAGNNADVMGPYVCFPGDLSSSLNVINVTIDEDTGEITRAASSNYNTPAQVQSSPTKNLSAPGTRISSTWDSNFMLGGSGTQYASMDGTSQAAPCVSGIASLLFAYDPTLTPAEVEGILCASATDLAYENESETAGEGWDAYTGYGEVNAYHALQLLQIMRGEAGFEERSDATFKQSTAADGSSYTYATAEIGDSFTLALPFDGSYPFTWKSSNAKVATVDANGVVTTHASGSATISATMGDPLVEDLVCSIEVKVTPLNINKAAISYIDTQIYTGAPICTGISATAESFGRPLVEGVDYDLTYANNENVGTATVTVEGKGECYGTTSRTFNIMQADIADAAISIPNVAYTGKELKPEVTVTYNGKKLKQGTDYTLQYSNNVNPGTGTVRVKAVSGGNFTGMATGSFVITSGRQSMFRLYNPNSGEHFYTANASERDNLKRSGWRYEGVGWMAPTTGAEVYRLYNPNAGDHHYTTSTTERDSLKRAGWRYEGVGWYSDSQTKATPLYRQYNPNAKSGSHNYTTSKAENNSLVKAGWRAEGVGWYGV